MYRETETIVNPRIESPAKRNRGWRIFRFVLAAILLVALGAIAGAVVYYLGLKTTPQYSLALLVDAARRDDDAAIASFVDSDAVVENFVPQIVAEAVELYGRGLPSKVLADLSKLIKPVLPAIKERARKEIPRAIKEKTSTFERFPFWMVVIGADRMLNIRIEGDRAFVTSGDPDRPFECEMRRNGERWMVVGIKDKDFARGIAEKFGEQIGAATANDKLDSLGEKLGIKKIEDVLKKVQEIFR